MNINDFCAIEGSKEYVQTQSYISLHGPDFETPDVNIASDYLNRINEHAKESLSGLYAINQDNIYQFIQP